MTLITEIERWITITNTRNVLDSREIAELQNLLIETRQALVGQSAATPELTEVK